MANEAEQADGYLRTIARIEADIHMIDPGAAAASVSISLRRIADALEQRAAGGAPCQSSVDGDLLASFEAARGGSADADPMPQEPESRSDSWMTTDTDAAFIHDLCAGLRALEPAWLHIFAWMAGRGWATHEINYRLDSLTDDTQIFATPIHAD